MKARAKSTKKVAAKLAKFVKSGPIKILGIRKIKKAKKK